MFKRFGGIPNVIDHAFESDVSKITSIEEHYLAMKEVQAEWKRLDRLAEQQWCKLLPLQDGWEVLKNERSCIIKRVTCRIAFKKRAHARELEKASPKKKLEKASAKKKLEKAIVETPKKNRNVEKSPAKKTSSAKKMKRSPKK